MEDGPQNDGPQNGPESDGPENDGPTVAVDSADPGQLSEEPAERPLEARLGEPGRPLAKHSPFAIGFLGAAGALLAYWIGSRLLDIGSILVLIFVAFFLAVGLDPLVRWLMGRGLPRPWAVVAVVVAVLAALSVFFFALVPVITDQVTSIGKSAPDWLDQLQNSKSVQRLDNKYDAVDKLKDYVTSGDLTQRVFGGVVGVGLAILGFLGNAFVVTVLTLYFLATLPQVKRSLYRLAPATRRERTTALGDQILQGIGAYLSGAFVVAMCAGISTLVFLFVIGLGQYAVALALVVALLDVIPMIGATIGAIVVCAIGFATDVHTGIALVIFYVAYQQIENYLIYPRVMSKAVNISGLLTVIAALIGASLLGVVGALMAIPVAAAIVLLVNEVFVRRQDAH